MGSQRRSRGSTQYPTTDWKTVAGIGDLSDADRRSHALERLWTQYAPRLMHHLRHRFHMDAGDAEEALQSFVLDKVLVANLFAEADRGRGRFRTFLLRALENHVVSQRRRSQAAKRQPERGWIPLDSLPEHSHPDGVPQPSRNLDVVWVEAVLADAASRMQAECEAGGRQDIWTVFNGRGLEALLRGRQPVAYERLAKQAGIADLGKTRLLFHTGKRMFRRAVETVVGELVKGDDRRKEEFEDLVTILFSG